MRKNDQTQLTDRQLAARIKAFQPRRSGRAPAEAAVPAGHAGAPPQTVVDLVVDPDRALRATGCAGPEAVHAALRAVIDVVPQPSDTRPTEIAARAALVLE